MQTDVGVEYIVTPLFSGHNEWKYGDAAFHQNSLTTCYDNDGNDDDCVKLKVKLKTNLYSAIKSGDSAVLVCS